MGPPRAHGWLPEPRQGRPPRSGSAASVGSWGPPWLCRLMQIASASSRSKLSSGTMKPAGISSFDGWHPTVALGMFGQTWQLLLASNRVVVSGHLKHPVPAFATVWYPVPRGQVTLPTCKASRLLRLHSLVLQHLSSRTLMLPPETIVLVLPAKIAVLSVTFCAAKTASPVVASQSCHSTSIVTLILLDVAGNGLAAPDLEPRSCQAHVSDGEDSACAGPGHDAHGILATGAFAVATPHARFAELESSWRAAGS